MSDHQKCGTCGATAVAYDHGTERYVCVEHDRAFTEPLRYKTTKEQLDHRANLIAAVRIHLNSLLACEHDACAKRAIYRDDSGLLMCGEHAEEGAERLPYANTAAQLTRLTWKPGDP